MLQKRRLGGLGVFCLHSPIDSLDSREEGALDWREVRACFSQRVRRNFTAMTRRNERTYGTVYTHKHYIKKRFKKMKAGSKHQERTLMRSLSQRTAPLGKKSQRYRYSTLWGLKL